MRTLYACVCRLQVQVWRIRNLVLIGIDSAQLAPELWVIVPSGLTVVAKWASGQPSREEELC